MAHAVTPSGRAINPWWIGLTLTLATFMELLDTSIANVSLPHIAGDLGTSLDEATWVLTSYLVANAVVLPLSARLSRVFGRKNYYMTCVALFTVSSFMCGTAPNLGLLIFFRVLQGIAGGGLAPSELYRDWLQHVASVFMHGGYSAVEAASRAEGELYAILSQQASLLSYLDCFVGLIVPACLGVALAFAIKNFKGPKEQAPAH